MDAPHAGRFEGQEHRLPIRVYYEDTDFSGIVYHANYVRYFERGRSDFLRLAGVSHTELRGLEQPIAFAVVNMDIAFKRAARIDDALVVRTRYESMKGPRIIIHQQIDRDGELVAEARVQVVCIDMEGRARRMPAAVSQKLQAWFSQAPPQPSS
jgi:acyl-CoA thioester hydrolase